MINPAIPTLRKTIAPVALPSAMEFVVHSGVEPIISATMMSARTIYAMKRLTVLRVEIVGPFIKRGKKFIHRLARILLDLGVDGFKIHGGHI